MSQTSNNSWVCQDLGEADSGGIFPIQVEGSIPPQEEGRGMSPIDAPSTGAISPQINQTQAQPSSRPVLLTRPTSSHQDPAFGFTFAKAKPAQLFDFPRRPMMGSGNESNRKIEQPPKALKPMEGAGVQPGIESSNIEPPEQRNRRIDANLLKVQYPLVRPHIEREESPPVPRHLETESHAHQKTNSSSSLNPQTEINQQWQHRRQFQDQAVRTPAGQRIKNEDLLRLMMFRTHKENDEREKLMKLQHVQAEQIRECEALNRGLKEALNNAKSRLLKMEHDSQEHQARRSALEGRFKKLKDFLSGLSNDHNGLRDEARQLRNTQESLQKDRLELQGAIHDLKATFRSQETGLKGEVNKAHHKVTVLEESVRTLEARLCDSHKSLQEVRDNSHLHGEATERLSRLHGEATKQLSRLHGEATERLSDAIGKLEQISSKSLTLVAPAEWESLRAQNVSLERNLSLIVSSLKSVESEAQKQADENRSLMSLNKAQESKLQEAQAKIRDLEQRGTRVQSPCRGCATSERLTITPRVVEVQEDQDPGNTIPQGSLVRIMQESASKAGDTTYCPVERPAACSQGIASVSGLHDNREQEIDFSEFINTQEAFGLASSKKVDSQNSSDSTSVVRSPSKLFPQSTCSFPANLQLNPGRGEEVTGQELLSNALSDPSNPQLQSSSGAGNPQQTTKRKAAAIGPATDADVLAGKLPRRTTASRSHSPSITSDSQSQLPERRASLAGRGQKLSKAKSRRDSKVDRRFRQELSQNSQN